MDNNLEAKHEQTNKQKNLNDHINGLECDYYHHYYLTFLEASINSQEKKLLGASRTV